MAGTDHGLSVVVCDAGPLIHLDELACLDKEIDAYREEKYYFIIGQ